MSCQGLERKNLPFSTHTKKPLIGYIESSRELIQKLPQLLSEFNKVSRYKLNIQKNTYFYRNKTNWKKAITFTVA